MTPPVTSKPVTLEPDARPRADLSDVTVIIPAWNEEVSLPFVLRDLPSVGRVLVVDNGSTDGTARVGLAGGATVVHEPRRGYGSACLRGLATIQQSLDAGETSPRVVVFADADYSDHVHLLPELVAPIQRDEADLVLGSRMLGQREPGAMPAQSLFGNRLACWLMRRCFGARYTDLGPFRAVRYQQLLALQMADRNFGWTIEMQIKAARHGLRTCEIAVPYRRRIGKSKISGTIGGSLKAGAKILWTIGRYGLRTR